MLERYVENYENRRGEDFPEREPNGMGSFPDSPPNDLLLDRPGMMFELSTFYSVKYDNDGKIAEMRDMN